MRLLILLLLTGCTTYHPTENRDIVVVKMIVSDDLSWLGLDTKERMVAGYHRCDGNVCTIWIPSGINTFSMCVMGHEMMHLKYGLYHDEDNGDTC